MKINFASSVGAVVLVLMSYGVVQAETTLDEWRTPIACAGKRFEVISRCHASSDPTELNVCEAGQQLVGAGRSIQVPTCPAEKGNPVLFATFWSCMETIQGPVIRLGYTSGEGRSPNDEDVEFFDDNLQVIRDEPTLRDLYKTLAQAKKGYVKSIMPGEGN